MLELVILVINVALKRAIGIRKASLQSNVAYSRLAWVESGDLAPDVEKNLVACSKS